MAAPIVNSAEELFQLTGSWEAAAALRDAQNNALNQYNWSQQAAQQPSYQPSNRGYDTYGEDFGGGVNMYTPVTQQAAPVAAPVAPTGGLLSGNILAGASWNSLNPTLAGELTAATGQATSNYAVGGATTADTLAQLNTYLDGGGKFDPTATVFLQTGGVDFLQGVDKTTIKDNINQICKTLGDQGVNVVLTGSPYAKSINDVVTNNFDPKVDPLFNEIAKENKNVALVGVQGEILQNKKLLVDALHTNAEGTSIYNQAVINSLSQFENEVPSSTPQAIAQVQKTNTVATTPPIITQAAASPVVAQALATQAPNIQELIASGALQPNQATLIGDTYYQPIYTQIGSGEDAQLGPLENVITYKANENQVGGNVNFYDPTGKYQQTTQQQEVAGSFLGGLAEAFNDPVVQAAFLGLGGGGFLGSQLGLTGSAAQAVGTGLFKGGTAAAGGASIEDALKTGLLSGGLVYGGNALNNYLTTGTVADPSITERAFATLDAKQLADQGLTATQIKDTLSSGGYNDITIERALSSLTGTPVAVSAPVTDTSAVNIAAPSNVSLNNVLSTIAAAPVAVSTPVTDGGTVKVTGTSEPQMTTQQAIDLVNSQLAANLRTPANLATQTITGQKPATSQEIVNAITATLPNVTSTQAQNIAQQVITSNRPVTTQEVIAAITATLPALTTGTTLPTSTVPTTTITAPKTVTTQDIVNAIIATTPAVIPTSTVPTTTITAARPVVTPEAINTIASTLTPTAVTSTITPTTTTPTTTTDPLKVAQLALAAAGLLGAGSKLSTTTPTTFPVVPVPPEWTSPTKGVAPYTPLPPIDFGNRNLLKGTQWEKFLSPSYGKVPAPVQYSQPSRLSYNDLMGILGSQQGMPSRSNLSINDVISGIQNQYGQTPTSTMG